MSQGSSAVRPTNGLYLYLFTLYTIRHGLGVYVVRLDEVMFNFL